MIPPLASRGAPLSIFDLEGLLDLHRLFVELIKQGPLNGLQCCVTRRETSCFMLLVIALYKSLLNGYR